MLPSDMALIGTITTLADLQQAFSDYLNEDNVPGESDVLYQRRTRWFNRGREDLAKRYFWKELLKSDTVDISAGDDGPYALPGDFTRPNALKYFKTRNGEVEFTNPYDGNGATLSLTRDLTTGLYQVTLDPRPTEADTADLDYFATPTPMSDSADLVLVDGEVVLFYAMMQHFFSQGAAAFAELDRASQEYENRIQDLLRLDAISLPGQVSNMQGFAQAHGLHNGSERSFYGGNTRRGS